MRSIIIHCDSTHVALLAVKSCLDVIAAVVAGVDESVPALVVQLIQHGHGGVASPTQRGELPVSLPSHGEEGVSPVHQVTLDQLVGVGGPRQGGADHGCWRLQGDHKEHLEEREGGREGRGGEGRGGEGRGGREGGKEGGREGGEGRGRREGGKELVNDRPSATQNATGNST